MSAANKTRIALVVSNLDRGGIATWLLNVLSLINWTDEYEFHLIVQVFPNGNVGALYNDFIKIGAKIHHCKESLNSYSNYISELNRIMSSYGPFDIAHSHMSRVNGLILRVAAKNNIAIRVCHSHNDKSKLSTSWKNRIIRRFSQYLINKYATHKLATSIAAGHDMFGQDCELDYKFSTIYCGIDIDRFSPKNNDQDLRKHLNIPYNAKVIGHVGRFAYQKNHQLLVEIASHVCTLLPNSHFILVGEGELKNDIMRLVQQKGLKNNFSFLGARDDVPSLMVSVMDIFCLTSRFEGLGLALIEAQSSGLPCIASEAIPKEANVVPSLVTRMEIEASSKDWAEKIVNILESKPPIDHQTAYNIANQSSFTLSASSASLFKFYKSIC